jgi:polyphosphate:AMP phosphotransferase
MFDSALLKNTLDKETFLKLEPGLREDLLEAQFELAQAKSRAILVLINGADGAGKGDVLNRLYAWLDAHFLETLTYGAESDVERNRPPIWKYWRDMPPRGRIGIVLGSWYHDCLYQRASGQLSVAEFSRVMIEINRFEAMLHAEGVTLIKLWLHVDPDVSRRRIKKLKRDGHYTRPVVREWAGLQDEAEQRRLTEAALATIEITSVGYAPWHVIPAADNHYRDIAVGTLLLDTLRRTVTPPIAAPAPLSRPKSSVELPRASVLSSLDLTKTLSRAEYDKRIKSARERITEIASAKGFAKTGVVCVFEGNDAAGKGGAILRVRESLDPRQFRVHPISAPSDEEKARPYLWRFWRQIPARGNVAIFDRSWYGRVLVERVEGFCSREDWERAYSEINGFEAQLHRANYVIVKYWMAISQSEQLRRFKEREATAYKRHKITDEDWRNREKWPLYEEAVTDMVDRTSLPHAPWTLIAAEDKYFARVSVLEQLADQLEAIA